MKKQYTANLVLGLLLVGLTAQAHAATMNLPSTGTDGLGNLLTTTGQLDGLWTVDAPRGGIQPAVADFNAVGWAWANNGPNSAWIGRTGNVSGNGSNYNFYATFSLTGFNLNTVVMNYAWSIDDNGSVYLNGNLLSSLGNGNWGSLHSFSLSGAGNFNQGTNYLQIALGNSDSYYEAARFEGTITGDRSTPVPEPATLLLFGTGVVGLTALARRKGN